MSYTSPIQKLAKEFAYADIATQAANLQNEQNELNAESSDLDSLSTALTNFQTAIDALNSDTHGPLTFSATSSNDANTVSANSEAQAGTYSFYVSQLAQAQQTTFSMSDDTYAATGTFELTMDDGTTISLESKRLEDYILIQDVFSHAFKPLSKQELIIASMYCNNGSH